MTTLPVSKQYLSTLVRPNYEPGQLLNDDDLDQAVTYTRDLNRLVFRYLLGCGVICGLHVAVNAAAGCNEIVVTVGQGLALAGDGSPIHVPEKVEIKISDNIRQFWVVLKAHERSCMPRATTCGADEDDAATVFTRVREGYEITLMAELPGAACSSTQPAPNPVVPGDCIECACSEVLLAKVTGEGATWSVENNVRRDVRGTLRTGA